MKQGYGMWILAVALGALPAFGQASGQTSQPAPAQQPAPQPEKKAKKVWTNDDLAELPGNSPVSTAAAAAEAPAGGGGEEPGAGAAKPGAKPGEIPPDKDPKVYKEKLDALHKRLDDIDAKIKSIQDSVNGATGSGGGGVNLTQPTPVMRPSDQIESLQKERADILQQIDDLESQARKNSISPGDIR